MHIFHSFCPYLLCVLSLPDYFILGEKNATPVTLFKLVSKTKLVDLFGSSVDLISGWSNFSFSWVKSCDLLLLIIIIINHFCSTHIFLELELMLFWCVLFNNRTQITLITNYKVYVQYLWPSTLLEVILISCMIYDSTPVNVIMEGRCIELLKN